MLSLFNTMKLYHRSDIDLNVMKMYAVELQNLDVEVIKRAWEKYRGNYKNVFMPTPAQLIFHIDDGRPEVNEAWSIIPWDESLSVVWNEEIKAAFNLARPLVNEGQKTSAFFVFKEAYESKVFENRKNGIKPKWILSEGFDKSNRLNAVKEAVSMGRITEEYATVISPDFRIETEEKFLLESKAFSENEKETMSKRKSMLSELVKAMRENDYQKMEELKKQAMEISNETSI